MELKRFGDAMVHVHLSTGQIETRPTPRDWTRKYVGARGLGVRYVFEAGPDVDPLSADNVLCFLNGPLSGSETSMSGRWACVTKSPLTGTVTDSHQGGWTGARLRWAAREVHALDFIEQLDGGFESPVLERGAGLSVGQKQLIAFARALAFDPRILILDEATSSVDTETEQRIQSALERLLRGRTSLVIAHRLSTVQRADRILVLHRGRLRELGTHQQLLAERGIYYRLYQLQYQDQLAGESELAS